MITLSEYITQIGDETAAELFQVKQRTVASWRRRERLPRPHHAQVIVEKSNGMVTMIGIYNNKITRSV